MSITKQVEIELTPEELALYFADLNSEDQAKFFNKVAEEAATWGVPFEFQAQYIVDEPGLTSEAKDIMRTLGNYAK